MADLELWHNPNCSKSRAAKALLEQHGLAFDLFLYLQTPPSEAKIGALLAKLGIDAHALVRTAEEAYDARGLSAATEPSKLVQAMNEEPRLIQRPILVTPTAAVIGRPTEVLEDFVKKLIS